MKTKHLFGLVVVVAVTGLATSAHAGVSLDFSFGLPVPVFHAPRSVAVYSCPPPVAYCPPPVVYCPPVYRPVPRCEPVYVTPRYERHYDYREHRGYDHRRGGREERYYGHGGRGHDRGGRH